MSLGASVTGVVFGYGAGVVTQILIFPIFGVHMTMLQNLKMIAVFTVVSIARSFALRRLFKGYSGEKPGINNLRRWHAVPECCRLESGLRRV